MQKKIVLNKQNDFLSKLFEGGVLELRLLRLRPPTRKESVVIVSQFFMEKLNAKSRFITVSQTF